MGIFGWSLPPGCSSVPGDETGVSCITPYLTRTLPEGVLDVFWDEDGILYETISYDVPADPECGIPAYSECDTTIVGQLDWNDDLSDEDNFRAAARAYEER